MPLKQQQMRQTANLQYGSLGSRVLYLLTLLPRQLDPTGV